MGAISMGAVLGPPAVGGAEALLDAPPMPRVAVVKLKPETGNNNPSLSIAPLTVTVYAAPAPNSFAGVRNASMPASAATTMILSIPLGPLSVTVSGFNESTRNGFENRKTSIGSSATSSALFKGKLAARYGVGGGTMVCSVAAFTEINCSPLGSKISPVISLTPRSTDPP